MYQCSACDWVQGKSSGLNRVLGLALHAVTSAGMDPAQAREICLRQIGALEARRAVLASSLTQLSMVEPEVLAGTQISHLDDFNHLENAAALLGKEAHALLDAEDRPFRPLFAALKPDGSSPAAPIK